MVAANIARGGVGRQHPATADPGLSTSSPKHSPQTAAAIPQAHCSRSAYSPSLPFLTGTEWGRGGLDAGRAPLADSMSSMSDPGGGAARGPKVSSCITSSPPAGDEGSTGRCIVAGDCWDGVTPVGSSGAPALSVSPGEADVGGSGVRDIGGSLLPVADRSCGLFIAPCGRARQLCRGYGSLRK